MPVARGAEQRERYRAARDGEEPIGHSEHHRESCGRRNAEPEQREERESGEQHGDRKACDVERMNVAREYELADARGNLCRPEQRTDRDHGSRINARAAEDCEQMRRETGRHEGVGGKRCRHQQERPTARWQSEARRRGWPIELRHRIRARARQSKSMQRGRDKSEHRGINDVGALPPDGLKQNMGGRPAHGRSESPGQRERGDRASCPKTEDAAERGKGRIVEGRGRCNPEQHPDGEISSGMLDIDEQGKTERAEERSDRHDPMSAVAVDQATDTRRDETRREQRQRKAAHGKAH